MHSTGSVRPSQKKRGRRGTAILHSGPASTNVHVDSDSSKLYTGALQGPIWPLLILPYACIGFRKTPSILAPHASDAFTWDREGSRLLRCNTTRLCQSCNHYQCKPMIAVRDGLRGCAKKITSSETLIAKSRTPSTPNGESMCMFKICRSIMD